MALSSKFKLPREKFEFVYSVAVLIIIPALIVANTFITVVYAHRDFNEELRRKANLANSLIAGAVAGSLKNHSEVQTTVERMVADNSELSNINIVVPEQSSAHAYTIIASSEKSSLNQSTSSLVYDVALTDRQAIAQLVSASNGSQSWRVVTPIIQSSGVAALVDSTVSSAQAQQLVSNTLLKSLVVLIATTVIVILLLINHFRFFQYAVLFKKLKEVDQLKTDFLSVATHELRAPMTIIKGTIENVQTGVFGPIDSKAEAALAKAFSETDRLTNLVNDLLNVSRLEQGRISYDLKVIDSREPIDFVIGEFGEKAKDKGLQLVYEKPPQQLYVKVDAGRLVEVMTNLVDNAIKYSNTGTVKISQKVVDGHVRISVRDNGIGMSAVERENLFNRFYRIRNDRTKDIGGTGLGLWIIKQYIESMGGHISVDSMEGVGSEFTVEFPLVQAAPQAPAPPDPSPPADRASPTESTD